MSLPVLMADSVDPYEIPLSFAQQPNGVAIYADGDYAWTQAEIERFPRYWAITVTGAPAMAPKARVIDVERGDATPADVSPYQAARAAIGFDCTCYCDRSTVAAVVAATPGWESLWWWIATLDNQPWTAAELQTEIQLSYGVTLPAGQIRAVQNMTQPHYDQSTVFTTPQWTLTAGAGAPSDGSQVITVTVAAWTADSPPWNSTLSGIAAHYNVTGGYQALAAYNGIADPDLIYPGQQIRVPLP